MDCASYPGFTQIATVKTGIHASILFSPVYILDRFPYDSQLSGSISNFYKGLCPFRFFWEIQNVLRYTATQDRSNMLTRIFTLHRCPCFTKFELRVLYHSYVSQEYKVRLELKDTTSITHIMLDKVCHPGAWFHCPYLFYFCRYIA